MANNYFDFIGQNAGEEKKEAPQQTQAMANVTVRCDADCFLLCDGEYLDIQLGAGKMAKIQVLIGQHLLEFLYTEDPDIKIEKEVDFPESGKSYLVIIKGLKDLVDGANAEAKKKAEEEKAKLLRSIDFTKKYLVLRGTGIGFRNDLNPSQIRSAIENEIEPTAKMGIASAEMVMYIIYIDGVTGQTSEDMAMPYLKSAAEKGLAMAQGWYGVQVARTDKAEAYSWYMKGANQGDVISMWCLGDSYLNGSGVKQDLVEAVKWFRKAAEKGYHRGQNSLAVRLERGEGVKKDITEAFKWYKKAAEQGFDRAQNNLGDCYYYGRGTSQNLEEALKWYKKAAEQGYDDAQCNLGGCYYYGWGTTINLEEAVKWYKKAAEQGYARAQNSLGGCYYYGWGTTQNLAEAFKWYKKAAEQGYDTAQRNLGLCYANGEGTTKNLEEAEKWLEKAAKNGDGFAKINLLEVRAER